MTKRPSGDGVKVVHSSDIHVDNGYTARAHGGDGANGLRLVLEARNSTSESHGRDRGYAQPAGTRECVVCSRHGAASSHSESLAC